MRWLLVLVVASLAPLAFAAPVHATPKLAVLPIDGDAANGQLTELVTAEAAELATVADATKVEHGMSALGIDSATDASAKELKKLRSKLAVDVIVQGKVEKDGKRLRLELTVSSRTATSEPLELHFAKASSKTFRAALHDGLEKRIASATEVEPAEAEPEAEAEAEPVVHKKLTKQHVVVDGDDEDGATELAHHSSLESAGVRHPVTQSALWLDAGGAGLRRTLTYAHAGTGTPPPDVGTAAFSAQVEGEYYPAALGTAAGAGFGLAGELRQTFGLAIVAPGTTAAASIDQALYSVGARYRFVHGDSSIAIGASYWRQRYVANRAKLATPGTLDMPDMDYTAIAPGATGKLALGPRLAAFASVEVPVVLSTGAAATNYGAAGGLAVSIDGGLDIALAEHYGLRFEGIVEQVGVTFDTTSTTAVMRGVTAATDRTMGVVATFAMIY